MSGNINPDINIEIKRLLVSDPHTLSLNGNKYDALSGKELDESGKPVKTKYKKPSQFIDGFFGTKAGTNQKGKKPVLLSLIGKDTPAGHAVAPNITRSTDRSKTLMRSVVEKPAAEKFKQQARATKKYLDRSVARGITATAPARASMVEHANTIKKSEFINKFNEMTAPASTVEPDPSIVQTSVNSEVHLKNLDHLSQIESNPAEAALVDADANKSNSKLSPTNTKPNFYVRTAQKLRMSTRAFTTALIILGLIITSMILIYIFSSDIRMFAADNRTGIQGTLPSYTAKGYKLKTIQYQAIGAGSNIVITYKANTGNGSYQIAEQYTTWDNQALLNTVVTPDSNNNYHPFDVAGRTVYLYNSSAAWVGSNVYYNLTAHNATLSPNEVSKIVSSS